MSSIDIHELVKQWGDVSAVDKVSFTVPEGSLTVLLGPSGCGKSTILRLIAGLEAITAGVISIGGKDVTHTDPAQRGVSMVFQSYALYPHMSVFDNMAFGLKLRKTPKAEIERRVKEAGGILGIEGAGIGHGYHPYFLVGFGCSLDCDIDFRTGGDHDYLRIAVTVADHIATLGDIGDLPVVTRLMGQTLTGEDQAARDYTPKRWQAIEPGRLRLRAGKIPQPASP